MQKRKFVSTCIKIKVVEILQREKTFTFILNQKYTAFIYTI